MLNIHQETAIATNTADLKMVYSKYASILFGYLVELTRDPKQAEDYLVTIYTELAKRLQNDPHEMNSWTQLRRFALSVLGIESGNISAARNQTDNKQVGLERLSAIQQEVFQGIYYQRSTAAALAAQLNLTEETIRKTLKDAFAIMKGTREN